MPPKNKKIESKSTSSEFVSLMDGRMPPQAIEVEKAVLGAILLEKDAFSKVSEVLRPESFYLSKHEIIYKAMMELNAAQNPIDLVSVTEYLKKKQLLEEVGGPLEIADLTYKVLSSSSLEYHATIVAEKAMSRQLIKFSSNVLKNAYEDTDSIAVQMQDAEAKLFEISQQNMGSDFQPISNLIIKTMQEIEAAANREDGMSGITSGFEEIDNFTSGWQKSDLIIIAARPAMGKTAFVLSMAKNMALDHNIPVAVFNLEMSSEQLTKRLFSNVSEIDGNTIKNGRLSDDEWNRLIPATEALRSAPLFINDTPSLSVFELRSKARRLVREYGVQVIIIDYLQLMNASGMGFGNREQEVSMISRSLKVLAKELKIPIIALSQLNRGVENRDASSKRPQLSDLRESGAIEQDADIVCFIHRPEYYKIYEDPTTGQDLRGLGEFIIAKHRNGPIGDARLRFIGDYAKFTSLKDTVATKLSSSSESKSSRSFSSSNSIGVANKQANSTVPPIDDAPPF